jgi:AraC-like DNA-binding protein
MYTECRPPAALAETVECFWTSTPGPETVHRVMPDGAIDIVRTYRGDEMTSATVVGTMTTALVVPATGERYVGVRFLPGVQLGIPADELTDRRVALSDVWRDIVVRPPASDIAAAIQAIRRSRGTLAIAALGPSLGMSRQQLARRFMRMVGVSPKTFARVVRLQALLRRAGANPDWSMLAYDLGYADQSHLANDFRVLTGLTPTAWFQISKTALAPVASIGA